MLSTIVLFGIGIINVEKQDDVYKFQSQPYSFLDELHPPDNGYESSNLVSKLVTSTLRSGSARILVPGSVDNRATNPPDIGGKHIPVFENELVSDRRLLIPPNAANAIIIFIPNKFYHKVDGIGQAVVVRRSGDGPSINNPRKLESVVGDSMYEVINDSRRLSLVKTAIVMSEGLDANSSAKEHMRILYNTPKFFDSGIVPLTREGILSSSGSGILSRKQMIMLYEKNDNGLPVINRISDWYVCDSKVENPPAINLVSMYYISLIVDISIEELEQMEEYRYV